MEWLPLFVTLFAIAATTAVAFVIRNRYVGKKRAKFQLIEDKLFEPQEYLQRLIEEGSLEQALEVCKTYKLDTDPVYQQMWLNSQFNSTESVYDYLAKVKDREWVLNQCLELVPNDLEVTRTLLNYALSLIEYSSVLQARSTLDEPYLPSDPSELIHFDAAKFDETQYQLIELRVRTLNYLDRLNTFQHLLDGIDSNFQGSHFIEFRDKPIVEAAVEFARCSKFHAVSVLMTWHGDQVLPHWLYILDEIPEVVSPFNYQDLLPECSSESVYPWEQATLREKDWSEILTSHASKSSITSNSSTQLPVTTNESPFPSGNLSSSASPSSAPSAVTMSREELTEWFIKRARAVEKLTGLVDNSLVLLKLGLQRNLMPLRPLHDDLEHFSTLLYECFSRSSEMVYISYEQFKGLSVEATVDLLLTPSGSSGSTFILCCNKYVQPYLKSLLARSNGSAAEKVINGGEESGFESGRIEKELQLLEALCLVALEFGDMKNVVLPCEVRHMKSQTLPLILQRSNSAYKKVDVLVKVIGLLCPSECSKESILQLTSEKALAEGDLLTAGALVDQLIHLNCATAWPLAFKLGTNCQIVNIEKRLKWLAYALIYCDERRMVLILDKIETLRTYNVSKSKVAGSNKDHLTTWLSSNLPVAVPLSAPSNLLQSSRSVISKTAQSLATFFRTGPDEQENQRQQRLFQQ